MPDHPVGDSPHPQDTAYQEIVRQFRAQVKHAKENNPLGWESTRKLVAPSSFSDTLTQLQTRIPQSDCLPIIQQALLNSLESFRAGPSQTPRKADLVKELTGLPPTKGIRALCLYFGLTDQDTKTDTPINPQAIEEFIRTHPNPYDWLLHVPHPSLLDLGAGDLSFEEELLHHYFLKIQKSQRLLTLHALDRLQPGSRLGGVYHANPERLAHLSRYPQEHLQFKFWGSKDMLDLNIPRGQLNRYSIVTCHAPATPTFAYEPTRLSPSSIHARLIKTKGTFRKVRIEGEKALEVQHRGRTLTFPSWKFVIRGPLALLDLMARRGQLCILSAIDAEVFWEILAQLIEDDVMRRSGEFFTPDNLPKIQPHLYAMLSSLKEGDRCCLGELTPLRTHFPHVLSPPPKGSRGFTFRYVEIRRGAVFPDMPASFTAQQFSRMTEEVPPWFLLLIPEIEN